MKILIKAIVPFLLIAALSACSGLKKLSVKNLNYLYRENLESHLVSKAYRLNDSAYSIYIDLMKHDKDAPQLIMKEGFKIEYSIYGQKNRQEYFKEDSVHFPQSAFPAQAIAFEVELPGSGEYLMNIKTHDANSRLYAGLLLLNNTSFSGDNYLAYDTTDNVLVFPYLDRPASLYFKSTSKAGDELWVYYYDRDFPPAMPPFIFKKATPYLYRPDSTFSLELQNGYSKKLEVTEKGFYHLLSDTSQREGYTVFLYDEGFPGIYSANDMLQPLRYISSDTEYEKMENAGDVRLAIEAFWLKLKGNIERARHAIRRYYSRVEDANILFSSYLPGWKSDRGMIYIVYGPPSSVNHGMEREVWTYGESNNPNALKFEFVKVDNPFTENDFQLLRSPNFKESWYFNIDNWRR